MSFKRAEKLAVEDPTSYRHRSRIQDHAVFNFYLRGKAKFAAKLTMELTIGYQHGNTC
jgi:hypothetical protein